MRLRIPYLRDTSYALAFFFVPRLLSTPLRFEFFFCFGDVSKEVLIEISHFFKLTPEVFPVMRGIL